MFCPRRISLIVLVSILSGCSLLGSEPVSQPIGYYAWNGDLYEYCDSQRCYGMNAAQQGIVIARLKKSLCETSVSGVRANQELRLNAGSVMNRRPDQYTWNLVLTRAN